MMEILKYVLLIGVQLFVAVNAWREYYQTVVYNHDEQGNVSRALCAFFQAAIVLLCACVIIYNAARVVSLIAGGTP